jgi:homocysteine S-methyltransferase
MKHDTFLILDGAMGTELERRGYSTTLPLWSAMANLEAPVLVKQIHDDYVAAGADIITTNTFRTTSYTFSKVGKAELAPHLTRLAVELARESAVQSGREVMVAGSLAPLEDCYRPDLVPDAEVIEREYVTQIDLLISTGVDLILAETMINRDEARFISSYLHKCRFPYMMSFTITGENLLDGTSLKSVVPDIILHEPMALLLNCRSTSQISAGLSLLQDLYAGSVGAYGNGPGRPDATTGWELQAGGIEDYLRAVRHWVELGVLIVGGCCGTTPDHIAAIRSLRDKLYSIND